MMQRFVAKIQSFVPARTVKPASKDQGLSSILSNRFKQGSEPECGIAADNENSRWSPKGTSCGC
jgi:hypothetical protein